MDKDWKDKFGNPIRDGKAFRFAVGNADRQKPIPRLWELREPSNGSSEPLVLQFDEVLDYALLQHTITIWNQQNQSIKGRVEIVQKQKEWHFYPDLPWASGEYRIMIDSKLEDLAGNNLNRLFDVDLQAQDQTPSSEAYHYRQFTIQ